MMSEAIGHGAISTNAAVVVVQRMMIEPRPHSFITMVVWVEFLKVK